MPLYPLSVTQGQGHNKVNTTSGKYMPLYSLSVTQGQGHYKFNTHD